MKLLDHPTRWQQPADYLTALEEVRRALIRWAARYDPEAAVQLEELEEESAATPEEAAQAPKTLATLVKVFELSPFARDVLMLCAGMELDAVFAPLCAQAQADPKRAYPTFGLALAALPGASWQALLPDAPLRYWQLVRIDPGENLTTGQLRIDERILHYLLGFECRDERLAGIVEPVGYDEDLVPSHRRIVEHLVATWERTLGTADFPVVELCGPEVSSKRSIAAAACARLGWKLHALPVEALPQEAHDLDGLIRLWHRDAILSGAALLLEGDEVGRDDAREASVRRFVDLSRGGLIVTRRRRLGRPHRPVLSIDVAKPRLEEQRDLWHETLAPVEMSDAETAAQVETLIEQFHLDVKQIRNACFDALGRLDSAAEDGGEEAPEKPADLGATLWACCRERARPELADLAERVVARATWEQLILPEAQLMTLREIAVHVRRRGKVYRTWGFAEQSSRGVGVSTLFAGSSGTGKTMAAEVLAAELDLDLYRIDLSSVVSKYIGETEKNLQRVFDAADLGGAILLFDEADALFGRRSEVKDSHDRHANIEVSYLLQRMETYRGLAILTTNLRDALDPAFKRRLRFIVEFPFPDVAQRREIWRRTFPSKTPTAELRFDRLARLNLAGGHIRNIAINAAFLAADEDRPVSMRDLLIAARREFAKLERPLSEAETRDWLS